MHTAPTRRDDAEWTAHVFSRPVVVGAVGVVLFNDYVLKRMAPGLVSGKLSDVAGLFVLPLIFTASCELGRRVKGHPRREPDLRMILSAILVSAVGFVVVKSSAFGAQTYSTSLSGLQWPFRQAAAALSGAPSPAFAQVTVRSDLTDLFALPILLLTWRVARCAQADARPPLRTGREETEQGRPADAM